MQIAGVEYRQIQGFPNYYCSNTGVVISGRDGKAKLIAPFYNQKTGYLGLCLFGESGRRFKLIHRLVGQEWLDYTKSKPEINHKNGSKTDNRVENLEWCTRLENITHKINVLKKGVRGEDCKTAKLKSEAVFDIRHMRSLGASYRSIAAKHRVSDTAVRRIITGETWRHL